MDFVPKPLAKELHAISDNREGGAVCDICGQPARVHSLEGYSGGQPVLHWYCLSCVTNVMPQRAVRPHRQTRLGIPILIGLCGVLLGFIGIFADVFVPHAHQGFGLFQHIGVALGTLFVFVGVLLRIDIVMLGGMFIFVAALCADWFGLARVPGIGQNQQIVLYCSAGCIVIAMVGRYLQMSATSRMARLNCGGPEE